MSAERSSSRVVDVRCASNEPICPVKFAENVCSNAGPHHGFVTLFLFSTCVSIIYHLPTFEPASTGSERFPVLPFVLGRLSICRPQNEISNITKHEEFNKNTFSSCLRFKQYQRTGVLCHKHDPGSQSRHGTPWKIAHLCRKQKRMEPRQKTALDRADCPRCTKAPHGHRMFLSGRLRCCPDLKNVGTGQSNPSEHPTWHYKRVWNRRKNSQYQLKCKNEANISGVSRFHTGC